ncbi:hypothetical protein ACX80N_12545 [Arthrobacter sp. MDT2-16]
MSAWSSPRYMRARHDEKFADHVDIVRFMAGSFDGAVSAGRSRFEANLFVPRDPEQRERDRPLFASLEFHYVALHYIHGARMTFRGTFVGSNAHTPGVPIERDWHGDFPYLPEPYALTSSTGGGTQPSSSFPSPSPSGTPDDLPAGATTPSTLSIRMTRSRFVPVHCADFACNLFLVMAFWPKG